MAHPIISILRRNQGYVLAVMGVVLIITWVIGPQAITYVQSMSSGPKTTPVVVQWKKGSLTEGDIRQLRREHQAVLDFTHKVLKRALEKSATPQAPGLRMDPRTGDVQQIGLPMDTSEATVVNILLFAERGKEMGVRVDQASMMNYLKNLSGFVLQEGDFLELAQQSVKDSEHALSVSGLFSALRKELVAQQAQYMVAASASNVSTGELWEYHKQLNLRYKIEAYPIEVEKLKKDFKASDAKDDELKAIFEKGKDRVPNPDQPEPGFRQPHRISFGYCKVDFLPFLEAAKKNVPEDKVVEAYKNGVSQGRFRKLDLPGIPPKPGEVKPGEKKPDEEKPAGEKSGDEAKAPPAEPAKEGKAKTDEKPAKEATEKPVEKPAEKTSESEAAPEKPEGVISVCDDEPAKAAKAKEEKKDDEKASPPKAETKAEPAKTAAEETPPAKPATTPPATGDKTEDPATKEPQVEEPRHKTLAEARDEILTELAQPEAVATRDEAMNLAIEELRNYAVRLKRFQDNKTSKTPVADVEDPGEFRPQAFAKKFKLIYSNTKLLDRHEVERTELGTSAILAGQRGSLTFPQFAYFEKSNLYDPHKADSAFGDTKFIYWRIAEEAEAEVTFDEAKDSVREAWVQQKAYEAAVEKAKDLAAKASKAASLRDVVGKDEAALVVEPFPFAMYTTDGLPLMWGGQPDFSRPAGIPMAGKEFMDAVFNLHPGEAGVAPNQPHAYVYVIRVVADEPSLDIRREMFLSALQRREMSDLMAFASIEHSREFQGLFDDLEQHFDVKWTRVASFGNEGE